MRSITAYQCLLFIFAPIITYAQTAAEIQQQLLQQQQQRNQDLRDNIEQQQKQHQSIELQSLDNQAINPDGPCFDIDTIILEGAHLLSPEKQYSLTHSFTQQCLNLHKINQLLQIISNEYSQQGYVTSRAYVSAQDLSQGQLIITVIEGTIEAFSLTDPHSQLNIFTAFPFNHQQVLNLRDIEQGLEQINRLQSQQATMELIPGEIPGSTVIKVKSQSSKSWQANLSRDNSGQRATGELMNTAFFSLDNPLGLNDFSYLNFQQDNEPTRAMKKSKSLAWHWDMPLGYWNVGVDISYFEYLSTIQSIAAQFETSGTNLSQTVFVSRILHRGQNNKLKLHSRLERKKSENFIEDILLDSSRILAIASVGLQYEHYLANQGQWDLKLNYYRGLSLFNAPKDSNRLENSPKAQFDKVIAQINYQQNSTIDITPKSHFPFTLKVNFFCSTAMMFYLVQNTSVSEVYILLEAIRVVVFPVLMAPIGEIH